MGCLDGPWVRKLLSNTDGVDRQVCVMGFAGVDHELGAIKLPDPDLDLDIRTQY
jgi:hypothetical protein